MKGLTLNQEEQTRLETLNRALGGELSVKEAAGILGVSERHGWRLLAAYRAEGVAGVVHGNRGRRPANAMCETDKERIITLATSTYEGVNHTHLAELLQEREGLGVSRSTVRRVLTAADVTSPRRRRPARHRLRRERLPRAGMLLQIDGSAHDWLEGRGPQLTLLLAVDDATGQIPWALFREGEDSRGYFLLLRQIIERCGIPLALYSDRHGIFRPTGRAKRQGGKPRPREGEATQFGRAMRELGVVHLLAWSPEAKGRVEKTVGTLQDRLVTELRLVGARTMEEANQVLWAYLPRYNNRFSVPAAHAGTAYRDVPSTILLEEILCFKYRRKVAKDNTIRHRWRIVQLLPDGHRPSYAGRTVELQEHLDGRLVAAYRSQAIPTREVPSRPNPLRDGRRASSEEPPSDWGHLVERLAACLPNPAGKGPLLRTSTRHRLPTRRMVAYWEAVQEAKSRGLSIRGIAKELGIARNTVRKYVRSAYPPLPTAHSTSNDGRSERTESLTSSP